MKQKEIVVAASGDLRKFWFHDVQLKTGHAPQVKVRGCKCPFCKLETALSGKDGGK